MTTHDKAKPAEAGKGKGSELVRFGVSFEAELLERFDALCLVRGYASRSEALRDVIRQTLLEQRSERDARQATGVLSLVYDHHRHDLAQQLTSRQHDAHDCIVASLHVHMDHHNCLEILVLKGRADRISELADNLRAVRGVSYGSFTLAASDEEGEAIEMNAAHEATDMNARNETTEHDHMHCMHTHK